MQTYSLSRLGLGILLCAVLAACGGGSGDPEAAGAIKPPGNVGGDDDLFAPTRVLQVAISLAPEHFQTLRQQGRSLAETARECMPEFEYSEFAATVTIDGTTLHDVAVRKKGFLGSLSSVRPSLKLDFDELHKGRSYQHSTRMTLNNNRQDASTLRQCLAYQLFEQAGLPAPRCNFARVSVNGEDLGIYTHVEEIKKPFLERVFGDKSGNLYEAQLADFGEHLGQRFEKKTNERENDRSDLAAVAQVMALPDEQFVPAIRALIDIDAFIRYWAMESLLGIWDSATGNANNFYLYRSPADGLFHFIPWGADTAFVGTHVLKPGAGPLYRDFRLAQRLYGIDDYRDAYHATLQNYLENHWDEAALLQRIAEWQSLLGLSEEVLSSLRSFIQGSATRRSQRALLNSAIAGLEPAQRVTLLQDVAPDCRARPSTTLSLNITSQSNVNSGSFSFLLRHKGNVYGWVDLSGAGSDAVTTTLDRSTYPATRTLTISGVDLNNAFKPYALVMMIEEPLYRVGSTPLHGFANTLMLFEVNAADPRPETSRLLALGHSGTLHISERGQAADDLKLQISGLLEYLPQD